MDEVKFASKEQLSQMCDDIFANQIQPDDFINIDYIAQRFRNLINDNITEEMQQSLRLIASVCSCYVDNEGNWHSLFTPNNLNEYELSYLAEILDVINQAILKARIADILWNYHTPKKIHYARTAIENYLSISDFSKFSLENYRVWHRAAFLAKSTKQQDFLDEIKAALLQEIDKPTSDWCLHKSRIAEIFLRIGLDKKIFESLAEKMLLEQQKFSPKSNDFNVIQKHLTLAETLFEKSGNQDKKTECIHLLAQATEQHGDFKIEQSDMVANHFYKLALQIYRKIPSGYRETYNTEQSLTNIQHKITQTGNKMMGGLQKISIPLNDIERLRCISIKHVKNKQSLEEALVCFIGVHNYGGYQKMLEQTENIINQSILGRIIPSTTISSDGRVIARIEALNSDGSNRDIVLFQKAIKDFFICIELAVCGCILPALGQIHQEHHITREFLIELCRQSAIVPEKREMLLGNALYYGFQNDFATSIHLLAPQVENMIRQLFKKHPITTTTTDKDGIEHEIGLSSLVDKKEAKDILGEDLWFELQAVFTSSLSANLRNMVGHGLLDDETSQSINSVYAWWMILRLIISHIKNEAS